MKSIQKAFTPHHFLVNDNPDQTNHIKNGGGFTLLEILLVVLITLSLTAIGLPLGFDFYQNQQLETQTQEIIQTLRVAQFKAISMEYDSSFGVYFTNDQYVLFKGDSFSTRDVQYDEVFGIPTVINLSGLSEVVFSKLEGIPLAEGTIILSTDSNSREITINGVGRINLE